MSWFIGAAVVAVAIGGTVAAVMLLSSRQQTQPTFRAANPTLARDLGLLDQPRRGATVVAGLPGGTRLRLLARLQDGTWLFVSPADQIAIAGWVPVEGVRDPGHIAGLAVIDAATGAVSTAPASGASPGPRGAAPDLAVQSITSQQDRLTVTVANVGQGDLTGAIMVAVNDGPARRIDVGKPLRNGEALQAVLNTEFVQRRARVTVSASTPGDTNTSNDRLEAVVAPDVPLDLEVASAASDPKDGHLVITLRARGPIPLVGTVSIGVRQSPPSNRLIASLDAPLDIAADGTQRIDVAEAVNVDLTKAMVSIATDAIADVNSGNDSYPR